MNFRDQLFLFLDKIDKKENFALSRYWDWERLLMEGEDVTEVSQARKQDKRKSKWMTKLWEALKQTLDICSICFYYAIPCQCCNANGKYRYMDNIKSNNFTFANLFINNNYQYFKERLKDLKRDVILIANYEWKDKKYPFPVKEFIPISDDCVNYFENNSKEFINKCRKLAKENVNQLFFISAWPLANIAVYEMRKENPDNTYIDIWSAIDERTKGRITRWFQRPQDMYAKRYCRF